MLSQFAEKSKVIFPLIRASVPLRTDSNPHLYRDWLGTLDRFEQLEIMQLSARLMQLTNPLTQIYLISAIHRSTLEDTTPLVQFLMKEQHQAIRDYYIENYQVFERLNNAFMIYSHQVAMPPVVPPRTDSILAPKPLYPHQLDQVNLEEDKEEQENQSHLPSFKVYLEKYKQERGAKGGLRKSKSFNMEDLSGQCAGMSLSEAAELSIAKSDDSSQSKKKGEKFNF